MFGLRVFVLSALLSLVTVACSTPLEPSLSCSIPEINIADWERVTSRYGVFSLKLPSIAEELEARCIDSACGIIDVGTWQLGYDMGTLAGPGNSHVEPHSQAELADRCTYPLGSRELYVTTFRFTNDTTKVTSRIAGKISARAATELEPGRGLYFSIYTDSVADLHEFLRAITTTEIDF